jgi:hypothetical protein
LHWKVPLHAFQGDFELAQRALIEEGAPLSPCAILSDRDVRTRAEL